MNNTLHSLEMDFIRADGIYTEALDQLRQRSMDLGMSEDDPIFADLEGKMLALDHVWQLFVRKAQDVQNELAAVLHRNGMKQ